MNFHLPLDKIEGRENESHIPIGTSRMTDVQTPGWIVQTGRWLKERVILTTACIAILFTVVGQYEAIGLPIVATRSYADGTTTAYLTRSGIDKVEYPNVKNYIDQKDEGVRKEMNDRLEKIERQNVKIITQVDLMLTLMQTRMIQSGQKPNP